MNYMGHYVGTRAHLPRRFQHRGQRPAVYQPTLNLGSFTRTLLESRRDLAACEDARIDRLSHARNHVEVQLIAGYFGRQERQIGIEPPRGNTRPAVDIPRAQLAARPDHEVCDALLRLHTLVEVIVPVEHDAHVVFQEQRLQRFAQPEIRAVPVA